MGLRPIPVSLQTPAVEDVADQIEVFRFRASEKVEKEIGLAAPRPEVDIGDPDCPIPRSLDNSMVMAEMRKTGNGSTAL